MPIALNIVSLKKTAIACPSQWQGLLGDGRTVYFRYRGGRFTFQIGKDLDDAVGSKPIIELVNPEDPLDGAMDEDILKEVVGKYIHIKWPETIEGSMEISHIYKLMLMSDASDTVHKMIDDGTLKVLPEVPESATFVTLDEKLKDKG